MDPNLLSYTAVLAGHYHLSVLKIQSLLKEQLGTTFSIGAISEAHGFNADAAASGFKKRSTTGLKRAGRSWLKGIKVAAKSWSSIGKACGRS